MRKCFDEVGARSVLQTRPPSNAARLPRGQRPLSGRYPPAWRIKERCHRLPFAVERARGKSRERLPAYLNRSASAGSVSTDRTSCVRSRRSQVADQIGHSRILLPLPCRRTWHGASTRTSRQRRFSTSLDPRARAEHQCEECVIAAAGHGCNTPSVIAGIAQRGNVWRT
jgi:hypothetical protein